MTARYFTARRALWVADQVDAQAQFNIPSVSDHTATDTGLIDANGDCIMRAPRPMGFGRDDEW